MSRDLWAKIMALEFLSADEAKEIFLSASLAEIMEAANSVRFLLKPERKIGWIIDRNVNITNVCMNFCSFCNFCKKAGDRDAYITNRDQYREKIEELIRLGGDQILLQGGMHPELGLSFYEELFRMLKNDYPAIKLHALGPPEIDFLSKKEGITYKETLLRLSEAGLDSLPGAGAEILHDRVRKQVSPTKCTADEWLDVMREAHQLGLTTSATMMFGHIETLDERIEHMIRIRDLQTEKPAESRGFVSFIPWPFMSANTRLEKRFGPFPVVNAQEYVRMIALARIVLPNIPNIQASWLTVGKQTAQLCLHAGANDMGSIMIEENVVSSAGASFTMDAKGIQEAITEAGFIPWRRNQEFEDYSTC